MKVFHIVIKFFRNLCRQIITSIKCINNKKFNLIQNNKELHIVMNGPSFREEFKEYKELLTDNDVMCSNFFVRTEYFEILKPKYYVIADSAFFNEVPLKEGVDSERISLLNKNVREAKKLLLEKTKWPMYLITSKEIYKNETFMNELKRNRYIKLYTYNFRIFSGFNTLKYKYWKSQKCCPIICNVLILAIYISIIIGFSKIYLYGTDHNFFKNLYVDENNNVYEGNDHFYKDKKRIEQATNPLGDKETIGTLLQTYCNMWNTYYELEKFAKLNKTEIINCTKTSMIDAFKRDQPIV